MNALKVFLTFALLAITLVAHAEAPTLENLTAANSARLTSIFNQQQRNMNDGCSAVKITRARAIQVANPLQVDASGKPTAGLWRVRFAVDACTRTALRMAQFTVTPSGISIDPLAPGETLADPKLQNDVIKSFGLAGQVLMPKCTAAPILRDTKVRVFPAATNKERWVEIWIGHMCGRDIAQMVDFFPGKTGTVFKMSLPKTAAK